MFFFTELWDFPLKTGSVDVKNHWFLRHCRQSIHVFVLLVRLRRDFQDMTASTMSWPWTWLRKSVDLLPSRWIWIYVLHCQSPFKTVSESEEPANCGGSYNLIRKCCEYSIAKVPNPQTLHSLNIYYKIMIHLVTTLVLVMILQIVRISYANVNRDGDKYDMRRNSRKETRDKSEWQGWISMSSWIMTTPMTPWTQVLKSKNPLKEKCTARLTRLSLIWLNHRKHLPALSWVNSF